MGIVFPPKALTLDVESHSITERYKLPPREYFRLGQYAWGESGDIRLTTDYDEIIDVVRSARVVIGHNIHGFDLSVLFGKDSTEPLEMAAQGRVFDTLLHAILVNPAPRVYQPRVGKPVKIVNVPQSRKYFSLDNQAFQLGVEGKSADLADLAKKYTWREVPQYSTKTGKLLKSVKRERLPINCCAYSMIPVDDPDFEEYARQDVICARNVARALLSIGPLDSYAKRFQHLGGIYAQISRNGMRSDLDLLDPMIYDQDWTVAHELHKLHEDFGFPIQGKKPLTTNEGKEALLRALLDVGADTNDLARTDKGALSFGGESIQNATEKAGNDRATALGDAVAALAGVRTLPQLTKASTFEDGFVHPDISPLQRSRRLSTTNPGLTVFNDEHKVYYLPDNDDELLVEFDLSNADPRAVAALSGDRAYAIRFEPGNDGHMMNAIVAWGAEKVATDPKLYRQKAKIPGNGWNYLGGAKALAGQAGESVEEMQIFVDRMNAEFRQVVAWQKKAQKFAREHGYVENLWGGRMLVEPDRMYTQPPALLGQNFTQEIINDALIKLPLRNLRQVKLTVHDALLASIPVSTLEEDCATFIRCMTSVHHPPGGQRIEFPVKAGPPGKNWLLAIH